MEKQWNIVCGADIHKKFLIATILSRDGTKITKRFGMTLDELLNFKNWVIENGCEQVAVESTGTYWVPIHTVLEGSIGLIVGNAYKIKHTPGNKNDLDDADWIAELCLNGMIEPSRIFPKADRDLRRLTRIREGYVNDMTREKNRIHHALESCGIKLSSVLSDMFGKTGQSILSGLLEGRTIDDILKSVNLKRIKATAEEIREAIKGSLDFTQILLIRGSLEQMAAIQKRIDEIHKEIKGRIAYRKDDLKIAMSIPGVGFTSASTLLAEIGDITDFKKPEQLAAWAGLVPSVYQSAGKLITGSITKHGSRHIRWILVQVARVIARGRESKLKRFFLRVKAKKGSNVAVVALARKVLCILHHLLINREMYKEDGINKKIKIDIGSEIPQREMDLEEMITYLVRAGYEVRKGSTGGG
ncbi:IS110 family transposase [Methanothrix sp.]|jgi:transposase|uniref:IS110 family transposase n=1 Tax=Methanothrix sp. TaxID=90426 RepID=UPI003299FE07